MSLLLIAHTSTIIQLYNSYCKIQAEKKEQEEQTMTKPDISDEIEVLAHYLLEKSNSSPSRVIISISGIPGTGKSFISSRLSDALNQTAGSPISVVVPMDGFHLTKRQLSQMPSPEVALSRRGAPWTFDGNAFVALIRSLKAESGAVLAPSFDHSVGDPVERGVRVEPEHRVVLVEGLYAHVGEHPWHEAIGLYDELWWVECEDRERLAERLAKRHLEAGLEKSWADAMRRVEENDMRNAGFVEMKRVDPTRVIYN